MENMLHKFIGDRSVSILDHINRYCLAENKSKLDVVRVVFNFLEGIKTKLDDKFVEVCLGHITKGKDDLTKFAYSNSSASVMRFAMGNPEIGEDYLNDLIQIEGNRGPISRVMKFCLNEDLTDWEKVCTLREVTRKADDISYFFFEILFYSNKSGIEIKFKNSVDEIIIHKYNRLEFIEDFDLVDAEYNNLIDAQKPKQEKMDSIHFTRKFTPEERKKIYDSLVGKFLSNETDKESFNFVFGENNKPNDFSLLPWSGTLKELNGFINTFFNSEKDKWEKAVNCFLWNGAAIKKKSLSTAIDKYDEEPKSINLFRSLYKSMT